MYTTQGRKSKIELSDYDFEGDLSSRLILSKLSVFEVEVLKEIVYNSLSFPVQELAETLETSTNQIQLALQRLEPTQLYTLIGNKISVNKEKRKYFEVQIERFSEDFEPDTVFFQSLLGLVPIHVLPGWYSVPKASDGIIESIIDKCHRTTKLFERYLAEIQYEDEQMEAIVNDVYHSAELSIDVSYLINKYSLTREKLEETLIFLEFCKICCLIYKNDGEGNWKQVVTPFYEWRQYLTFLRQTEYKTIEQPANLTPFFNSDFGFIEELDKTLRSLTEKPITEIAVAESLLGHYTAEEMQSRIIERIRSIQLTKSEKGALHQTENTALWLEKPIQEKAMALYFNTIHKYRKKTGDQSFNDRDIREVERGLKRILAGGWIPLDQFIRGLAASLGKVHEITLQKKGRHWSYAIPSYDEKQLVFIRHVLFHHLLESGMIAIGVCENTTYLSITRFGQLALGD